MEVGGTTSADVRHPGSGNAVVVDVTILVTEIIGNP
jgi:hypothetical protein